MSGDVSFDRVRPRAPRAGQPAPEGAARSARGTDRAGTRALFSDVSAPLSFGSVALHCQRCGSRSVLGWVTAARWAFPSLVSPAVWRGMRVYGRCPACHERAWVRLSARG